MPAFFKMASSIMDPVRMSRGEGEGREDSGQRDSFHRCCSIANDLGFRGERAMGNMQKKLAFYLEDGETRS